MTGIKYQFRSGFERKRWLAIQDRSSQREERLPLHSEFVRGTRPHVPDSRLTWGRCGNLPLTEAGLEGSAWVKVLIDKAGNVADAKIRKTSGHEFFDRAVLAATKKTTWKPAEQDGKKVAVWVSYQIKFQLSEKGSGAKSKN